MLKVENVEVWGFEHAVRGMRNPMNSWEKSDSEAYWDGDNWDYSVGEQDLKLMHKLYKAGPEHRKYLRQIFVSMDIIAPLYWWKEFDTYKIGTTANSCSTMHKIAEKYFEEEDFSCEHLLSADNIVDPNGNDVDLTTPYEVFCQLLNVMNTCRDEYLRTHDKDWWWQMIQLLPSSYNQRRTVTMTYENVVTIIKQRSEHKLDEWRDDFVPRLRELPYIKAITEGCE